MALYSRSENNAQSLKVLNTTEKNSVDKYDWDNTLIVNGPSTVAGAQGYATAARRTIYIDDVEATLPENRLRGLTAPGWWEYFTYTDASGNTRHKAQHLVAFKDAPVNTADLDDAVAADVASAITISGQPSNQSTSTPAGGILTVDTIGAADALRTAGTYTIGASDYLTEAAGTGATFSVVVNGSGAATVTVTGAGSGFIVDETITIDDADLGNGGAADLTFDVATVALLSGLIFLVLQVLRLLSLD